MKKLLFLLAGCVGVSNATAETIALKRLGDGSKILIRDRLHEDSWLVATTHIFVAQTADGRISYIRVQGECVYEHVSVDLQLPH